MRPRRDFSAALDRHAGARHGLLVHHEGNELSLRSVRFRLAKYLGAAELLLEPATPAEPGRDRVGIRRDVLAVEREARLDPKRVARTEPARDGAALEHAVPERNRVLRHHEDLASLLAGVTGAVHHALDPVDLAFGERELRGVRQTEALDRAGALDGDERILIRDVADVGAGKLAFLQPFEVRTTVGRVDNREIPELVELVRDQVVDDPPAFVRQQRVLRLPHADSVEVVRERRLQELRRARAFDLELAHV